MVDYEQALSIAKDLLGKIDKYCEYKDYYVFSYHTPVIEDSSSNLVAIEKKTGKAYNFIAVITKLGKMLREGKVRQE
ncbi:hypothetical protein [Fannyhessea vaginae]|uniref:hypothetical protein n=1 Tax=Fannyhessea vaginae TaxID=82135 RepID=UPI00076FB7B1|nr:hypothetical protein [Fannyhessea vaginae]KXG91377.1 hypothetical protein HMPREF3232_00116 [Fannyhessea vaginae]